MNERTLEQRLYTGILTVICLFAVITQFVLHYRTSTVPPGETIIRYFTFFTILTNGFIAFHLVALTLFPNSRLGERLTRQSITASLAVHITVVALVYNTVLRFTWEPIGLQKVVDELLHLIIPILFVSYWIAFVPKTHLRWRSFWPWLIYPLGYVIIVLLRGRSSGYYPYPFLDVKKHGLNDVLLNSAYMTALFLVVSLIYIGLARTLGRRKRKNS